MELTRSGEVRFHLQLTASAVVCASLLLRLRSGGRLSARGSDGRSVYARYRAKTNTKSVLAHTRADARALPPLAALRSSPFSGSFGFVGLRLK
jgi:hypothetical protein